MMSSIRLAVSRLSSKPTKARVAEIGAMIASVSHVRGTPGRWNIGRVVGIWPMSPTVRTSSFITITTALMATMATRGEGTALVMRGKP